MDVRGRNLITGLPEAIECLQSKSEKASLRYRYHRHYQGRFDECPPEILSDLMDNGICLAGGTSQLQGLAERLSNEIRVRVWVAEDPMTCVARGCGLVYDDMEMFEDLFVGIERDPYKNAPR